MSGWIKMGVHLRTHPKVVRMASALRADRLRVVGGLWAVWCIFDAHTDNGLLEGYTLQAIDDDLGWKGFAAAMQAIGWLEESESGLLAPDYDDHNGVTAKRRAMETSRKGSARKKSANCPHESGEESGQMSASDADKVRNREEKIREEPIHSEAIASAAGAAPPMSVKDRVWALGLSLLGEKGRAKLGKLVSTHGESVVLDCLQAAAREQPGDPFPWLVAACEARAAARPKSVEIREETAQEAIDNPKPSWALNAGFPDRFQAENAGCTAKNAHRWSGGQRTAA